MLAGSRENAPASVPKCETSDVGEQPSGLTGLAWIGKGCSEGSGRSYQSRVVGQISDSMLFFAP
jgi:hypothetical protein